MNSLINFSDLSKNTAQLLPKHFSSSIESVAVCSGLVELVESCQKHDACLYFSEGKFSLYQLIVQLIIRANIPANLYFMSWGLSEEPLRAFHKLKEENKLQDIYCILDYRIKERQPTAFQFCSSLATKIGFEKSHAKAVVIEFQDRIYTIIGSQNMTRNNKNEAGIILSNIELGNHAKDYLHSKIYDTGTKE
ncbi:hypothetical protein GOQ04_03305 [Emticicia sp. ODNR4P]|nr:hypothetical protein [Emticicia sp. ODNR4P]